MSQYNPSDIGMTGAMPSREDMLNRFHEPTPCGTANATRAEIPVDKPTNLYQQICYMDSVSDHLGSILCRITGKENDKIMPETERGATTLIEVLDEGAGMLERMREHQHAQLEELDRLLFRS
jgi:hypothetical protein